MKQLRLLLGVLCLLLFCINTTAQKPKKYQQELKSKKPRTKKDSDFFADFDTGNKIVNDGGKGNPSAAADVEINAKDGTPILKQVNVDEESVSSSKCPVNTNQFKYALQNFWMQRLDVAYICASQALGAGVNDELLKALLVSLKQLKQYISEFNNALAIPQLSDPKPILRDWELLGPFPVGKMEIDADPTFQSPRFLDFPDFASYILAMSSNAPRVSELLTEGKVVWKKQQAGSNGQVDVHFAPQWNELGQGLSSTAVYEYQAWARTTTFVKAAGSYIIDCQGPHTVYVRNENMTRVLVGDVYRAQQIKSSIDLKPGLVGIVFPIRAVVQTQFICQLLPANNQLIVYPPTNVPHVIELSSNPGKGFMLSNIFSLTVHNTFSQTVTVEFSLENPIGEDNFFLVRPAKSLVLNDTSSLITVYSIAAGQTMSLPLEITLNHLHSKTGSAKNKPTTPGGWGGVFIGCRDSRVFQLIVSPSKGNALKVPLDLSCRKQDQSFLFSYLDHDGSVAQAGVVLPLNYHTPNHKTLAQGIRQSRNQLDSLLQGLPSEFPVLLSLHGSGIQPLNHADAHKYMPIGVKNYVFGIENYFLVTPSRFGAHNWEGVGDLSARWSVLALQRALQVSSGLLPGLDMKNGIISGHSMGGHGAWVTAMNDPTAFQCILPTSGWIKKEEYGNSNLFLHLDVSNSFVDPALKTILERSLSEYHVDHFVSNLQTSLVHVRVGSHDFTTHPWYSRRMFRLLKAQGINATMEEIFGKQHWWWDTAVDNDGGVLNDPKMRSFYSSCHSLYNHSYHLAVKYQEFMKSQENGAVSKFLDHLAMESQSLAKPKKPVDKSAIQPVANSVDPLAEYFTYARCERNMTLKVINPAVHEGFCGVRVLQQHQSLMLSSVSLSCSHLADTKQKRKKICSITTGNARRLSLDLRFGQALFEVDELVLNQQPVPLSLASSEEVLQLCIAEKTRVVSVCPTNTMHPLLEKTLTTYGPIRRLYDRPFVVVYGTPNSQPLRIAMRDLAMYLANSHYASHFTSVQVYSDLEFATGNYLRRFQQANILFVGDASQNKFLRTVLSPPSAAAASGQPLPVLRGRLPEAVDFFAVKDTSSARTGREEEDDDDDDDGLAGGDGRRGFRVASHSFNGSDEALIFTMPLLRTFSNISELFFDPSSRDALPSIGPENQAMGLVLAANSLQGYLQLSRLAWPVIPPMVRAPFANYLPDFVVLDRRIWDEGLGGILAAGYWDMDWKFDERQTFVASRYL